MLLEEMESENFEEMVKQGAAGRREVRLANKYIFSVLKKLLLDDL